jgi:hypothetical protein
MYMFPHKKWNPFIQFDWHKGVFLNGPIPVPGAAVHFGAGILAEPFIGLGTDKHNNGTIFGDGMEIVSRGHSPMYVIAPHWNLYPFTPGQPNLLIPALILGSSMQCMWAVCGVRGPDGPIAVSNLQYVGLGEMACADPCDMPTAITFNWGTIKIGFTWGDLAATLICIAFQSAKSALLNLLFDKAFDKFLPKGLFKSQMKSILGKFGLPKIFRGEGGRFASMAEKEVSTFLESVAKDLYGGGERQVGDANLATQILSGDVVTGKEGLANQLGDYIDGRSTELQ